MIVPKARLYVHTIPETSSLIYIKIPVNKFQNIFNKKTERYKTNLYSLTIQNLIVFSSGKLV